MRDSLISFELESMQHDLVCTSGILIDMSSEAKLLCVYFLLIQHTFRNINLQHVGWVVLLFLLFVNVRISLTSLKINLNFKLLSFQIDSSVSFNTNHEAFTAVFGTYTSLLTDQNLSLNLKVNCSLKHLPCSLQIRMLVVGEIPCYWN